VIFDADEVVSAETFETVADENGGFEVTIDPLARPAGRYRITASQILSGGQPESLSQTFRFLEAETAFRTPCNDPQPPPPELDPACGPARPGEADAYEIEVAGAGFIRGGVVILSFGRGEDAPQTSVRTDRQGAFTTLIRVPGRQPAKIPVRAVQRDSLGRELASAVTRFIVPCPFDPRISMQPDAGAAGFTTLVEGTDFEPGSTVTLTWDRGIEAGRATLVEVEPDGSFRVYLYILPNDLPGTRRLTAGLPDDPEAFPDATGEYLVAMGSGQPPTSRGGGFVDRR
jgi:hypothetical protein